jgi:hypothetical protein
VCILCKHYTDMSDQFFGDTTDKATFALTLAMATNPLGAAMLGADLGMRVGRIIGSKRDQQAAAAYDRKFGARDARQAANMEKAVQRAQQYYAKKQAASEMRAIRAAFEVNDRLTAEDVKRAEEDKFINDVIGQSNLRDYREEYNRNMIANNREIELAKKNTVIQQSRSKLEGLRSQTAAARALAAEKDAASQQQREEYMRAIQTKRDAVRQQQESYENNLARSAEALDIQQNITDQNQMVNQRAKEQAAAIAASRPAQSTATPYIRPPRRLPPSVALPKY